MTIAQLKRILADVPDSAQIITFQRKASGKGKTLCTPIRLQHVGLTTFAKPAALHIVVGVRRVK